MQSLVESDSMVLMKIIFLILSMYFRYYLSLEKCEALCLNKHESPSHKDDFCQVWFNCPSGSGEEDDNMKSLRQRRRREQR